MREAGAEDKSGPAARAASCVVVLALPACHSQGRTGAGGAEGADGSDPLQGASEGLTVAGSGAAWVTLRRGGAEGVSLSLAVFRAPWCVCKG